MQYPYRGFLYETGLQNPTGEDKHVEQWANELCDEYITFKQISSNKTKITQDQHPQL